MERLTGTAIGAGAGLLLGGLAGWFAGGKKSRALGVSIGTGAGGLLGAGIGFGLTKPDSSSSGKTLDNTNTTKGTVTAGYPGGQQQDPNPQQDPGTIGGGQQDPNPVVSGQGTGSTPNDPGGGGFDPGGWFSGARRRTGVVNGQVVSSTPVTESSRRARRG